MDLIGTSDIQVSVIILNYNTKEMTVNCVESYIRNFEGLENYEIILVDNCSTDGSWDYFNEKLSTHKRIRLVYNEKNVGFGNGNNIGVEYAKGRFLIFANSDTLVKKFDVQNMINCFIVEPNIGVLSCKILNQDGSIQSLGFSNPSVINDFKLNFLFWNFNIVKKFRFKKYSERGLFKVDWVSGSFFMCRRDDFLNLNGFDSNIFMYAEDLDLCARIRKLGKENYVLDSEEIYHLHGKSSNVNYTKLLKEKQNYLYVIKKNRISKFPKTIMIMHIVNITVVIGFKRIISCFRTKK